MLETILDSIKSNTTVSTSFLSQSQTTNQPKRKAEDGAQDSHASKVLFKSSNSTGRTSSDEYNLWLMLNDNCWSIRWHSLMTRLTHDWSSESRNRLILRKRCRRRLRLIWRWFRVIWRVWRRLIEGGILLWVRHGFQSKEWTKQGLWSISRNLSDNKCFDSVEKLRQRQISIRHINSHKYCFCGNWWFQRQETAHKPESIIKGLQRLLSRASQWSLDLPTEQFVNSYL